VAASAVLPSPQGGASRLLHTRSISGLCIPFTDVPASVLPVYASPGTLPYPTQDSVPDCCSALSGPPSQTAGLYVLQGASPSELVVAGNPLAVCVKALQEQLPSCRARHDGNCCGKAYGPGCPDVCMVRAGRARDRTGSGSQRIQCWQQLLCQGQHRTRIITLMT